MIYKTKTSSTSKYENEQNMQPTYNSYEDIITLATAYQERNFTSAEEYIADIENRRNENTSIPSMTSEHKKMLKFFIENPDMLMKMQLDSRGERLFNVIVTSKGADDFISAANKTKKDWHKKDITPKKE